LNGKRLSWEAIVLIPFCDERIILQEEENIYNAGLKLTPDEQERNTFTMSFHSYKYCPN